MEPIKKGWYTAKGVLVGTTVGATVDFTIYRGVAGHKGRTIGMPLPSQAVAEMVANKLINSGWCMIKVCHIRNKDSRMLEMLAYVNDIHSLEK